MKKSWKKVRKELEITKSGEFREVKQVFESKTDYILGFDKKEFIDLIVKIVGIIAIFIPIFLFYLNDKSEKRKERELIEAKVFLKNSSDLNKLINTNQNHQLYDSLMTSIFYNNITELHFFGTKRSNEILDLLELNLRHKSKIDSLYHSLRNFRKSQSYQVLERQIRQVPKFGRTIEMRIDSLLLGNSLNQNIELGTIVSNYVYEVDILRVEDSHKSSDKMKTLNYLSTFSKKLWELDSLQNTFLWSVKSLRTNIQIANKYLTIEEKATKNYELKKVANDVNSLEKKQLKVINNLNELKIEHFEFINSLFKSFNNEFISRNEILNK